MKREETWAGDMAGIKSLRDGFFCQFGRETMEKIRAGRSDKSGSPLSEWGSDSIEDDEEKSL